jgi:thiol-disulfide isomerase/thioredoxin
MKIYLKYFALSLAILSFYMLFGVITYGDHSIMLLLTLITTFIGSYFIYIKTPPKYHLKLVIILLLPLPIIDSLIFIIHHEYSRGILYFIFIPISGVLAYWYYAKKKIIIVVVSLLLFYCVGFILFPNMFIYIQNKSAVVDKRLPSVTITDKFLKKEDLDKNKIIVLDFWSTSCGICFAKFPDLERTYLKYKNNPNVAIYAVNVPLKNDVFNKTTKILDSIGYRFPKLYAKSDKEMKDSLNIVAFPHLLILKNGKIRYDGILETDKKVYFYNIESQIDKLLQE